MTERRERAERHARWLQSLGFSPEDFARMKAAAERVGAAATHTGVSLDDLDGPYKVAAVPLESARYHSGALLGCWAGAALLAWTKTDRELAEQRLRPRRP